MHQFYCVYLLQSLPKPNSFYVGSTPDPVRRLRQHNGYIAKGGAYRTKKMGFRPWVMVACVCGFPSKVAALQFESALQHPFQSRHIEQKISKTARSALSVHHRLGNIRLLVEAPAFKRMALEVWIFSDQIEECWHKNRNRISCSAKVVRTTFDEAFTSKQSGSLHSNTSAEIEGVKSAVEAENLSCYECGSNIDAKEGLYACSCGSYYHPRCILRRCVPASEVIPHEGSCPSCEIHKHWAHVARFISLSRQVSTNPGVLKPYKPDAQLSQQVDQDLDSQLSQHAQLSQDDDARIDMEVL